MSTLVFATTIFVMAVAVQPASAVCSNASLKGVYGFSYGRPAGIGNPTMLVGQFTADGQGNLSSGSWTESNNGTIVAETFTGSYIISKDCTGSMSFKNQDGSTFDLNLVMDSKYKGFQMIVTDSGHTQPGAGIAQGTATCGLTGKKATYAVFLFGTLTASGDPVGAAGQVTLDGNGNLAGKETLSVNFVNAGVTLKGTYTQGANCLGTMKITVVEDSTTVNFNTVAVNGGKEVLLIETDPGTLTAGNAQQ